MWIKRGWAQPLFQKILTQARPYILPPKWVSCPTGSGRSVSTSEMFLSQLEPAVPSRILCGLEFFLNQKLSMWHDVSLKHILQVYIDFVSPQRWSSFSLSFLLNKQNNCYLFHCLGYARLALTIFALDSATILALLRESHLQSSLAAERLTSFPEGSNICILMQLV